MRRREFLAALAAVVVVWKRKEPYPFTYEQLEKAYHDVMCSGPGEPEVVHYVWNRALTDEELRYLAKEED